MAEHIVPLYRLELIREKDIPYTSASQIEAAAEVFHAMLDSAHVEKLAMIHCNSRLQMIGAEVVAIGSLESVGTTMSDLFKGAIRNNASSVWMAHNHVDGNVEASLPDFYFTEKAMEVSRLLDIRLEDHLVIGPGAFYSIRENFAKLKAMAIEEDRKILKERLLGSLPHGKVGPANLGATELLSRLLLGTESK